MPTPAPPRPGHPTPPRALRAAPRAPRAPPPHPATPRHATPRHTTSYHITPCHTLGYVPSFGFLHLTPPVRLRICAVCVRASHLRALGRRARARGDRLREAPGATWLLLVRTAAIFQYMRSALHMRSAPRVPRVALAMGTRSNAAQHALIINNSSKLGQAYPGEQARPRASVNDCRIK
jgi:hypothetical protein